MMLTGDNILIAKEIGRQVGIGDKIIRLEEIKGLSEDEQVKIVGEIDGLAEIYPEDKYRIVKLLFVLLGIYGIFVPSLTLHQVMVVLAFSALFTLGRSSQWR